MKKIARALISVSEKTGVVEFAAGLADLGIEIISTGGTAKLLREKGLKVREVAELTGFPEMLDGRVKTLHPKIHGGILAIRSNPAHQRHVKEHGIEYIDMGGPSMIRSAAKNFEDVAVVVDPADYETILEEARANSGALSSETRARLARKAFAHTAAYDSAIFTELARRAGEGELPAHLFLNFPKITDLRYGENPHQKAALYRDPGTAGHGLAAA